MKASYIAFAIVFSLWGFVGGSLYAFVAWIPFFKKRFELSQTVSLAMGTALYSGWMVGLPSGALLERLIQRLCTKKQWIINIISYGIGSMASIVCFAFLYLSADTIEDSAVGSSLVLAALILSAIAVAIQFGAYAKFLLSVIAQSNKQVQVLNGIAYAAFGLGGVVSALTFTTIASNTENGPAAYFLTLLIITIATTIGTNAYCGWVTKQHEDEEANAQGTASAADGSDHDQGSRSDSKETDPLLTNESRTPSSNPPMNPDADDQQKLSTAPTSATASSFAVVFQYLRNPDGALVCIFAFLKCCVGPVLTTQSGVMFKSVPTSLTGTEVVATLLAGSTLGRVIVAGSGLWATVGHCVSTILFLQFLISIGFLILIVVALVGQLTTVSIMLLAAFGGTFYGMMWSSDSPLLMTFAQSPSHWQLVIGFIISPVELAGCLVGNYVAGALYDAEGHLVPHEGVVCTGQRCFQKSFLVMLGCCIACVLCTATLCVRDYRRRTLSLPTKLPEA
jgi:hypothetical protein